MSDFDIRQDATKRKIRKLKKTEIKIRFGHHGFAGNQLMIQKQARQKGLVWDAFFGRGCPPEDKPRYDMASLVHMSKEAFQDIVNQFFAQVYYEFYQENGLLAGQAYDPKLLAGLHLPYDADSQAVKKQFRKLALQHHPDTGGKVEDFLQLMDHYRKLNSHPAGKGY